MAESRNLQIILSIKDSTQSAMNGLSKALSGIGAGFTGAVAASNAFAFGLVSLGVTLGGVALQGIKFAGEMETARMGLVTLLGSAEEADAVLIRLKEEAARTPFEIAGLTNATQLLTSVTKDGNVAIDILLDIGESLAAMGKGQAELDRIIVNLQQIGAIGKASMLDIKQFAFAGIPIFEMLQNETGLAGDALADFISEGGVTFELLTNMFDKSTKEGGRFFGAFKNQTGTLEQSWSNLKDTVAISLGTFVEQTGIFESAKVAIVTLTSAIEPLFQAISTTITFFQEHTTAIYVVSGAIIGALVPSIYAAASAFFALMLPLAGFMVGGAIIGGLVAGIVWLVQNWEMVKAKAIEIWDAVKTAILDRVNAIVQPVMTLFSNMGKGISDTWNTVYSVLSTVWSAISALFLFNVSFVVGLVVGQFQKMGIDINEVISTIQAFFVAFWDALVQNVTEQIGYIQSIIESTFSIIQQFWMFVWDGISAYFSAKWEEYKGFVSNGLEMILGYVRAITKPITDAFANIWSGVLSGAMSALEGAKDVIKMFINWVITKINNFIKKVNDIASQAASITGFSAPQIPEIPFLADGGIVTRPTLAMVGEGGEPEAVIPLSKLNGFGGGIVVNVTGNTISSDRDIDDIAERVGEGIMSKLKLNQAMNF